MIYSIVVDNIKCGGCANSISKHLLDMPDISKVKVHIEQGIVEIEGENVSRDVAAAALAGMGYPETGSVEGLRAAGAKAKSFVSCAIGRIDK